MSEVDLWFTAQTGTRTSMVTTDADGRFEARGLDPETKWAQTVRKGTSPDVFGSVTFELMPPADPPVELVLRELGTDRRA